MTNGTIGLICLTMFLSITVLTGGGWAQDTKTYFTKEELEQFRDTHFGPQTKWIDEPSFIDSYADTSIILVEPSVSSAEIFATLESSIYKDDTYQKLSIGSLSWVKEICFKLKGDDVERCVKTEWLYELLKMIHP